MSIDTQVYSIHRQHLEAVEAVCEKFFKDIERLEEERGLASLNTTIRMKNGEAVTVTTAMEQAEDGYRFVTTTESPKGY